MGLRAVYHGQSPSGGCQEGIRYAEGPPSPATATSGYGKALRVNDLRLSLLATLLLSIVSFGLALMVWHANGVLLGEKNRLALQVAQANADRAHKMMELQRCLARSKK